MFVGLDIYRGGRYGGNWDVFWVLHFLNLLKGNRILCLSASTPIEADAMGATGMFLGFCIF